MSCNTKHINIDICDEICGGQSESNKTNITKMTKTKDFVEAVSSIKSKLNGLIVNTENDGDKLIGIIKSQVCKTNKIVLEGTYLFNIYLLYILENNINMKITQNTIRRCCRHLLINGHKSRKSKKMTDVTDIDIDIKEDDDNYDDLENDEPENDDLDDDNTDKIINENKTEDDYILDVKKNYFNFIVDGRESDFTNNKGLMNNIDMLCNTYYTNLKVHICMNFKKYQKRYILSKLIKHVDIYNKPLGNINKNLNENNLQRKRRKKKNIINDDDEFIYDKDIKFVLHAVQQKINGKKTYTYQKEDNKLRYDKLENKLSLNEFIENEKKTLKEFISYKISDEDTLSKLSDIQLFSYLRYFYHIQKELIKNKDRRINIAPHFAPKNRCIRFSARSLYDIYNRWKGEEIGVKYFESNLQSYLYKMFDIEKKYMKILKKYPSIRSISTDGCSITVNFEQLKSVTYIPKDKNIKDEEINEDNEIERNNKIKNEQIKEVYDFEIKYYEQLRKNRQSMVFDVNTIKTTEEFLKRFRVVGGDIGNQIMIDFMTEDGLHLAVHKNEYNDISHINRNKKIQNEEIKKITENNKNLENIYTEMSIISPMTTEIKEYMQYVETVRKNWKEIWDFCTSTRTSNLKFNSYVYKNHAVSKMAKKIICDLSDKKNVFPRHKKFFDEDKFTENKNKPLLLAIGTGNGNITISNTKYSGPKGPLKKLIYELGKLCTVVLVPEYNTSQLCCKCEEYLEPVNVYKLMSEKKKENKKEDKIIIKIKEEYTMNSTHMIHENKEMLRITKKKKLINEENIKKTEEQIKAMEKGVMNVGYYGRSYRLRQCINKMHTETGRRILFERNYNSAINMIKMFRNIILTGTKGHFSKSRNTVNGNSGHDMTNGNNQKPIKN